MGAPAAHATRYRRARITTPEWTAEFVTDGTVRKSDEQLDWMIGMLDAEVWAHIKRKGWTVEKVKTDLDLAAEKPLVQAILEAFPGAVIKNVRKPRIDIWDTIDHKPAEEAALSD